MVCNDSSSRSYLILDRFFIDLALRGKRLQQRIDDLLHLLHLQDDADREVRHFSRGMQQKVAIAAALLHDPDVLLLDEPTLGLDVQAAKSLEQTIVKLADQGKAVLLTTHQLGLAQRLSHTTFIIRNGRQVAYDRTQTLLQQFQTQTIVEVKLQDALPATIYQAAQAHFPHLTLLSQNGTTTLTWPLSSVACPVTMIVVVASGDVTISPGAGEVRVMAGTTRSTGPGTV